MWLKLLEVNCLLVCKSFRPPRSHLFALLACFSSTYVFHVYLLALPFIMTMFQGEAPPNYLFGHLLQYNTAPLLEDFFFSNIARDRKRVGQRWVCLVDLMVRLQAVTVIDSQHVGANDIHARALGDRSEAQLYRG